MRATAILLLLVATAGPGIHAAPGGAGTGLELPDGRTIPGRITGRGASWVLVRTAFGSLRVPRAALTSSEASPRRTPEGRHEVRTRWFVLESDLTAERAELYADELDAFFDWMVGIYRLDRKALRNQAPFGVHVYRSRADFKEIQNRVAPGIEQAKGQGFSEGVAGFHAAGTTYLWDVEGQYGGANIEVAKHETTHLLNHLFARATGTRFPVWFEEGTAVYFEAAMTFGGEEPEDNPAALATVLGEVVAGNAMGNLQLRMVPYSKFYGREYSWGWALVRFLRRDRRGARWKPFLEFMRTASRGAPSDSENRRFLKAIGFRSDEVLDEAWHADLRAAKKDGAAVPLGASPEALAEVERIESPSAEQARTFARFGESFARKGLAEAAVTYLRAALRHRSEDRSVHERLARIHRHMAEALALRQRLAVDEAWPEESLVHLRAAVEHDPLRAALRRDLGRQLLLCAETDEQIEEARDMLGLAFLLAGPDDDHVSIALEALRGLVAAEEGLSARAARDRLLELVPAARESIRTAHHYFLQADERWEELVEALEERNAAGDATFENRKMLAGLYRAGDRLEEAAVLYEALLEERPATLTLWPPLIDCLAGLGRREDAVKARDRALRAIDEAPGEHGALRRRILRIFERR